MTDLADCARRELEIRRHLWPREVNAGRGTREEANADLAAWREIEALAVHGQVDCRPGELPQDTTRRLLAVLAEAEERRRAAAAELAPDHPKRASREARFGDTVTLRRQLQRLHWRHGWATEPEQMKEAA